MRIIIIICISTFLFFGCKSKNEKGFVFSKTGLHIRKKPSLKSKSLLVIPFGKQVQVLSKKGPELTIEKIKSRWYRVKYNKTIGWSFGGLMFLNINGDTIVRAIDKEVKKLESLNYQAYIYPNIESVTKSNGFTHCPSPGCTGIFVHNNKIRIFIRIVEDPEGAFRVIQYYSESGKIIQKIYYSGYMFRDAYRGRIYFYRGRPIKIDSIKITYSFTMTGNKRKVYDDIFPPYEFFYITKQIKKKHKKIFSSMKVRGCYTFSIPTNNYSRVYINEMKVAIRKKPSSKSKALRYLSIMTSVRIKPTKIYETRKNYGKHQWFKVNYGNVYHGYVYGGYIKPVKSLCIKNVKNKK